MEHVAILHLAFDIAGGRVDLGGVHFARFHVADQFGELRVAAPVVLLPLNANQTSTTRHKITSHRTAFRTLDEFMKSPNLSYLP